MGPNNLCYVTLHFLFFPYVPMSLSTVSTKGQVGFLQTFKVAMSHFVFTHVERSTLKAYLFVSTTAPVYLLVGH